MMFAAQVVLVSPDTGEPAGLVEKVAFVGASLSTLGASVVEPTNGWWDVLSMIAAVNRTIVLTLAVSFVLNILQITTASPLPGVFVPRDPVLNFPTAVAQLGNLLERAAHSISMPRQMLFRQNSAGPPTTTQLLSTAH